jgi:hypothetical protein
MKKLIIILSVFLLLLFYSCVGLWRYHIEFEGKVLSNITGEPIEGAQVTLTSRDITVLTDSLGFFNLIVSGNRRRAPERIYRISKDGYKDFEIEINQTRSQRVYSVTRGTRYYDFGDKRLLPDSTNLSTWILMRAIGFENYSKDFTTRNDSFVFYMDADDIEIDLENYLSDFTDGWKIK